jgi:hypothetical protein
MQRLEVIKDEETGKLKFATIANELRPHDEKGHSLYPESSPGEFWGKSTWESHMFESNKPYAETERINNDLRFIWDNTQIDARIVANRLGLADFSIDSDKAKELDPVHLYYWIKAKGHLNSPRGALAALKERVIPLLKTNNILTTDTESELIQTHYYEELFRNVQYETVAMPALRGVITAKSGTVRLPTQSSIKITAATDITAEKYKFPEGVAIDIDTGTYSYQDVTTLKYVVRGNITDEMRDDALYPLIEIERARAASILAQIANYDIEDELYTNAAAAGTEPQDLAGTAMTLANVRTGINDLQTQGYKGQYVLIAHPKHVTTGLLADTNLIKYLEAGTDQGLRAGVTGRIFNSLVINDVGSAKFSATTAQPGAVLVDPQYSGVFVERYPPRIANWPDYVMQGENWSVTHKFVAAYLWTTATHAYQT